MNETDEQDVFSKTLIAISYVACTTNNNQIMQTVTPANVKTYAQASGYKNHSSVTSLNLQSSLPQTYHLPYNDAQITLLPFHLRRVISLCLTKLDSPHVH